jgi:MFS family permease
MNSSVPKLKLTTVQWLVCIIAAIGFAFDIYELLMLPLIIKPAMATLSAPLIDQMVAGGMARPEAVALWLPGGAKYVEWVRVLFFVPALVGGVFGLLGGYLTDLLGRRRVLTFSILLYAFSAFGAGFVTSLEQLLVCRCLVFVGVCVEFVAAVAWLAELFPNPQQREKVLGYTQAFSSLGGFLVAFMFGVAAKFALSLPAIHGVHEAWRYTLISGVIPALPLILIRPFLPESPAWAAKKAKGTLKRPSIAELFSPELRRTTILTTVLFATSYGIAFGAIQQLPQIIGGPKGHAAILAKAKAAQDQAVADAKAAGKDVPDAKTLKQIGASTTASEVSDVSVMQETGGLVGRFLLAVLALKIASRRNLFRVFQIPSLIVVPLFFYWVGGALGDADSYTMVKIGIFVAGLFTVAQFSFWGNYIPLVFPVHLRGTGESFAANIGGRIIGTAAAWFTISLSASIPPSAVKLATMAAVVAGIYALVGTLATHWLPEPKEEELEH